MLRTSNQSLFDLFFLIFNSILSQFLLVDYNQYSLNNQTEQIISPTPNIRVTEVSVSPKTYTQRPKKVDVNEADKYNLNQDVTVQDYDIYDTQVSVYLPLWNLNFLCYSVIINAMIKIYRILLQLNMLFLQVDVNRNKFRISDDQQVIRWVVSLLTLYHCYL